MKKFAFGSPRRIASFLAATLLLVQPHPVFAQVVSTFASIQNATGLATDGAGNLYIGSQTPPNSAVYKCTPPSGLLTVMATVTNPIGVVADPASANLYIADFGSNRIVKVPLAGGPSSTLASIPGPGWLALDATGNVYVAQYHGLSIYKVTPAGVVSLYVNGYPFPSPGLGPISMSASGVLYAATSGGAMYSIGVGGAPITPFATLPACGSLTPGSGAWFAGTSQRNTIDQIGFVGAPISIFAGQDLVSGHVDGWLPSATFNGINGIVWLNANDLYVAESGNNDVRLIDMAATPLPGATTNGLLFVALAMLVIGALAMRRNRTSSRAA